MSDLESAFIQQDLADVVGISQKRVSELFSRGIVDEAMTLQQAIAAYCAHLREIAAGRLAAGDLDLAAERAGLARAQREKIELQNAVTRRELAPLTLIEQVLGQAGSRVAAILEAVPGAIRRRNSALTADDLAVIAEEIARARNLAAGLSLESLEEQPEDAAA